MKTAGKKVALISTVEAIIGDKKLATGLHTTTPSPFLLQKLLRDIVNQGFEYVVLEATSHGLDQYRVLGCNFSIGVITNITPEHLDYHKTFSEYQKAKAKLIKGVKFAVLNYDDKPFDFLKTQTKGKVVSYSSKKQNLHRTCHSGAMSNPAEWRGSRMAIESPSRVVKLIRSKYQKESKTIYQLLEILVDRETVHLKTKLLGDYNVANILAAVSVAKILKISSQDIQKAVENFQPVEGRFEIIKNDKDFWTIVDFAHTPNALENLLKLAKELNSQGLFIKNDSFDKGRIIVVFGCAGERDREKRPKMGEIACQLTDITILTAEDPRTEDVSHIIKQIIAGCKKVKAEEAKDYFVVPDRYQAIEFSINNAKPNDIILICGKGHEKSMCFGKVEQPWSDQEAVREVLNHL